MSEATPTQSVYAAHPLYLADESSARTSGQRRSHVEKVDQSRAIRALLGGTSAVYAVQFPDGVIKIGWSADVAARHRHFREKGGEIVAFRPGTYDDEQALHASLRQHVARGREFYHPTVEVLAVVNEMRDVFGLPHLAT